MANKKSNNEVEQELTPAPTETITTNVSAASVAMEANKKLVDAEARRKSLIKTYKGEEKVPMYLSPMYRPYFGNTMRVTINGISIFFKVDGSTQYVPKTFADEIASRRMAIDAILTKQNRMSNVSSNFESAPGELNLF